MSSVRKAEFQFEAKFDYVPCNLCGSTSSVTLYSIPDFMLGSSDDEFSFVRCTQCGLVYQSPRSNNDHINDYYPPEYPPFSSQKHLTSWLLKKAINYGLEKRCNIVTHYKKNGRLLDFGCATGDFLHVMAQKSGWDLYGIDINSYAVDIAKTKHLRVFAGTLDEAKFPDKYFDVITLWEVLEHLRDPIGILKKINDILKPDGLVIIRVPNLQSIDEKMFGKYWAGYDAPRHLYVFSPQTIRKILNLAGFEIIEMNTKYGNYPSFAISLNFWMTEKIKSQRLRKFAQTFIEMPLVRVMISPIFFLSGLTMHGATLTVVAQKR